MDSENLNDHGEKETTTGLRANAQKNFSSCQMHKNFHDAEKGSKMKPQRSLST